MPGHRALTLLLALTAVAAHPARAQVTAPQPFLATVSPAAGRAGTTVELAVGGADLDGATRLHFSVSGITSAPKLDPKGQPVSGQFIVTIPPGTPTQVCDVRVVARYGISNPRGFAITALPVAALPASAARPETPFAAALNTAIVGTAVKQGRCFLRFEAAKGQRVIAVCQAMALDSRMDAAAALRDARGNEVARLQADGLLDFTAPAAGAFLLEVHDLMFRGDAEFPFVLTLTTGPVIERVFEGGAQWVLYGRSLPGGVKAMTRHGADLQRLQTGAEEARRLLAANPLQAARFGPEDGPPEAATRPVELRPPARYTGWFPGEGRARAFTFAAKKGDVFWIEIQCARRGIAADPFLVVDKGGALIAEANDRSAVADKTEFAAGWTDPSLRFEAKEDGVYRIKARNLFSSSPAEPFELTVQPAGRDFDLVALPVPPPKPKTATTVEVNSAPLWRGGVSVLKVFALRRGGFIGPIELKAEGLPADVQFLGGWIREGQNSGYAAFYAGETARDWSGAVRLHGGTGTAAAGATVLFKVGNTARESIFTRLTREVVLGVVPSDAPVTVEPAGRVFESEAGGKISIPLQVKRRGGCADAIKLTSLGIEGLTADIAANAAEGKLEVDVAKLKLPAGDHPLLLQGVVKFKHRRNDDPKAAPKDATLLVHSKPVVIRVKPAAQKS